MLGDAHRPAVDGKILATIVVVVLTICVTIGAISIDNNIRQERIESIKVEKQQDKSRKRKIWEREMSPSDNK